MLQPLEVILDKWPILYPEISGSGESDGSGPDEAARIREEVVAPLMDCCDIARTFEESREAYKRWKESLPWTELGLEAMLHQEDRFDNALAATFDAHRELLGDAAVKAGLENIRLRKIVRRSIIPPGEMVGRVMVPDSPSDDQQ